MPKHSAALPDVTVGGRTFTILFPLLLRPLDEGQRKKLEGSIRRRGVLALVVVDERDGVIDGACRVRIAAEMKLPGVPVQVRRGLAPDEKRELALSLNKSHRRPPGSRPRPCSPVELMRQGRVARVAERRRRCESLGVIAEAEGVSKSQVVKDLRAAAAQGLAAQPESG